MKIIPQFEHLQSGENVSRSLSIDTGGKYADKKLRLSFLTPLGKSYLTENLSLKEGRCEYLLPACLLDSKGILYAQIIIYNDTDYVCKSSVYEFPVYSSVDSENALPPEKCGLINSSQIVELLSRKADKTEVSTALSGKADKAEVETALSGKADNSALEPKADKTYVSNAVSGLVSESYLYEKLLGKADKFEVRTELSGKADKTETETALAEKADKTEVSTALAGKADNSALDLKADKTELADKADKNSLSAVALSGEYGDIKNVPVIPENISQLNNDRGYLDGTALKDAVIASSLSLGRKENTAKAKGSAVLGEGLIAENNNQFVSGKYNIPDSAGEYAVITGGGQNENARNNVHTIKWNGEAWFAGKVTAGGVLEDRSDAKELATVDYVNTVADGKQDTITVDTSVTDGSPNPVSSGAVAEAIKAVPGKVKSVNGKTGEVNLTASDVGALGSDTVIPEVPVNISAFNNDAGYIKEHQSLEAYALKADTAEKIHSHSLSDITGIAPDTKTENMTVPVGIDTAGKLFSSSEFLIVHGSIDLEKKEIGVPDCDVFSMMQAVSNGRQVIYDAVFYMNGGPTDTHYYFTASCQADYFGVANVIFTGTIPSRGVPVAIKSDTFVRFVVSYAEDFQKDFVRDVSFVDMGTLITDEKLIAADYADKTYVSSAVGSERLPFYIDCSISPYNFEFKATATADTPTQEQTDAAYAANRPLFIRDEKADITFPLLCRFGGAYLFVAITGNKISTMIYDQGGFQNSSAVMVEGNYVINVSDKAPVNVPDNMITFVV